MHVNGNAKIGLRPTSESPQRRIHREHQKLTVGKVHDVHHAIDERESDGDEREDEGRSAVR